MVLNVPRGSIQDLPDALQVGLPVGGTWRAICLRGCRRGLTRDWDRREPEDGGGDRQGTDEPTSHLVPPFDLPKGLSTLGTCAASL